MRQLDKAPGSAKQAVRWRRREPEVRHRKPVPVTLSWLDFALMIAFQVFAVGACYALYGWARGGW